MINSHKGNGGEIFVKINITSSTDTVLQLFYRSDNNYFDSEHCISKNIKKGFNEIIIKVEGNKDIKVFRMIKEMWKAFIYYTLLKLGDLESQTSNRDWIKKWE